MDPWSRHVPETTNVLVTHGQAKGHVDAASPATGCKHLLQELWRVRPKLHVCGHIHKARGVEIVDWSAVQWCYDQVTMGEGGLVVMLGTLGAWVWAWMLWMVRGKRVGKTLFVNAAVAENEGEEAVVVEI